MALVPSSFLLLLVRPLLLVAMLLVLRKTPRLLGLSWSFPFRFNHSCFGNRPVPLRNTTFKYEIELGVSYQSTSARTHPMLLFVLQSDSRNSVNSLHSAQNRWKCDWVLQVGHEARSPAQICIIVSEATATCILELPSKTVKLNCRHVRTATVAWHDMASNKM